MGLDRDVPYRVHLGYIMDTNGLHLPIGLQVFHPNAGILIVMEQIHVWDKNANGFSRIPTDKYKVHSPDGEQQWIAKREQLILPEECVVTAYENHNSEQAILIKQKADNMERMKSIGMLRKFDNKAYQKGYVRTANRKPTDVTESEMNKIMSTNGNFK
jgi:hypothetical protein